MPTRPARGRRALIKAGFVLFLIRRWSGAGDKRCNRCDAVITAGLVLFRPFAHLACRSDARRYIGHVRCARNTGDGSAAAALRDPSRRTVRCFSSETFFDFFLMFRVIF